MGGGIIVSIADGERVGRDNLAVEKTGATLQARFLIAGQNHNALKVASEQD